MKGSRPRNSPAVAALKCIVVAVAAPLLSGAASGQGWWDPDYSRRLPLTITNTGSAPTPSPTTAEVTLFAQLSADGTTTQFESLPKGTPVAFEGSQDDNLTVVTLPFIFPFAGAGWKRLGISPDGYVTLGGYDPGRPDSIADAARQRLIAPWSSDFAVTDSAIQGVWATLDDPTQVVIRWVVAETSLDPQPTLARFALILKPDGGIRFAYGTPCGQPSAYTLSYSPVKVGVGRGEPALSAIGPVFGSFDGHPDLVYTGDEPVVRADRKDIRVVRWHDGTWTELGRRVFQDPEGLRVVFRLAEPLTAGAVSAGEYYVCYGNASPPLPAPDDVHSVYDHVVDCSGEENVIGAAAPDWLVADAASGASVNVIDRNGVRQALLSGPAQANRALVAPGAMPAFLNPELEARLTPHGGGERGIALLARVPNTRVNGYADPDAAYAGGIGWLTGALGEQVGFASFINPESDAEPVPFGLTERRSVNNRTENVLFRADGNRLYGKTWHDREAEPAWLMATDYATADLFRSTGSDHTYDLAGAIGVAGYSQDVAVEYIAVRELGRVFATAGAVESMTPAGPFIQGIVRSSRGEALTEARVTVSGASGAVTLATGPDGGYRVTRPPGSYTVRASALGHADATVSGVTPSAAGQTDLSLPLTGVIVTGTARDAYTNAPAIYSPVTLTDASGSFVAETITDDAGRFSLLSPSAGTLGVAFSGGTGDGETATSVSGVGQRLGLQTATGETRTVELAGTLVGNGDMETPTPSGDWPLGWTTSYGKPASWLYSSAANHTPNGGRCIGVTDPPPGDACAWNPPPAAFWPLPTHWRAANVTFAVWVYFTAPGQVVRLRFRNGWEAGSVTVKCGLPPPVENENQEGLVDGLVPAFQWYEIRKTHAPSGPALDNQALSASLYHLGIGATVSGYTAEAGGTVYFDDFAATVTHGAEALARVTDSAEMPVADALVATVVAGDTTTASPILLLDGDAFRTDASGIARLRLRVPAPLEFAAWRPVAATPDGGIPGWGWTSSPVEATATVPPATNSTAISVRRAANVALAVPSTATTNAPGAALAVDGSLLTSWDSGEYAGPGETLTFDLAAASSVDQFELYWDRTAPKEYSVYAGNTTNPSLDANNLVGRIGTLDGRYGRFRGFQEWPLYPALPGMNGVIHVLNLPAARTASCIQVKLISFGDATRMRLQELRALSNAVPPSEYFREDVIRALRICGGLSQATAADMARLDVVVSGNSAGRIDLADAREICGAAK